MKKIKSKLLALLTLQCLIIVGVYWVNKKPDMEKLSQPLFSFDKKQVDKIMIIDKAKKLQLNKNDERWTISSDDTRNLTLEVDSKKLDRLLDKLIKLEAGWPTASTASSHQRFEVDQDNFQKHLKLYDGDETIGNLYIGTSPGFKKAHVRKEQDDEVYSVKINAFDLPTQANDWLDKSIISAKTIATISGTDYRLIKEGEQWQLSNTDNGDTVTINQQNVEALTTALEDMSILEVASVAPPKEAVKIKVSSLDNNWIYTFFENNANFYVQRDDINTAFKISENDYNKIVNQSLTTLSSKKDDSSTKENPDTLKPKLSEPTTKMN